MDNNSTKKTYVCPTFITFGVCIPTGTRMCPHVHGNARAFQKCSPCKISTKHDKIICGFSHSIEEHLYAKEVLQKYLACLRTIQDRVASIDEIYVYDIPNPSVRHKYRFLLKCDTRILVDIVTKKFDPKYKEKMETDSKIDVKETTKPPFPEVPRYLYDYKTLKSQRFQSNEDFQSSVLTLLKAGKKANVKN